MKVCKFTKTVTLAGLLSIPMISTAAEGLNYTFIELEYLNLDVDEPNESNVLDTDFDNGGGLGIDLSYGFTNRFFLYAAYSKTEADFSFIDNSNTFVPGRTDLLLFNLGLGYAFPMSDRTDFVLSGGYADIDYNDFDFGATNDTDANDLRDDPSDGYTLDAKIRSQFTDNIETSIGLRYVDIEDIDGLSLIANIMYEFNPNWGLDLNLDAGDELMVWGIGVRYSF